jgi:signal peptidase II
MNTKKNTNFLRWMLLVLAFLLVDQATKYAVVAMQQLFIPTPVAPFFSITLQYNAGAAFSFLADQGGWQRWFFCALAALVSCVLAWILKNKSGSALLNFSFAAIMSGAIGNGLDRLIHGYVIDFLDVHIGAWHYPTFNGADSFITIGVICLLIEEFFVKKKRVD